MPRQQNHEETKKTKERKRHNTTILNLKKSCLAVDSLRYGLLSIRFQMEHRWVEQAESVVFLLLLGEASVRNQTLMSGIRVIKVRLSLRR
jgi:hypothetical protein